MEKNQETFGMMLSKIKKDDNNKSDIEVITFDPKQRIDLVEKIKSMNLKDNNYYDINWIDFECVTIIVKDDEIKGFSSVWHRPKYYRADEVRILNRWYEHKSFRDHSFELARPHVIETVKHQLEFSKTLGYKQAFISRERNPRLFKKLITAIGEKSNTQWHVHDEKQCVCMHRASSCWQYKADTKL